MWTFTRGIHLSDFQGALKELILPASAKPKPWENTRPKSLSAVRKVRQRHKMVVSMNMAGFTNREIAQELGYTEVRVSVILNSQNKEIQEYRNEVTNQVAQQTGDLILQFRAESSKSLGTLVMIRDKDDAPLSEKRLSALAILDRAGYSPVRKQISLDATVPVQELREVLSQVDHSNEVLINRDKWLVKDVPKP